MEKPIPPNGMRTDRIAVRAAWDAATPGPEGPPPDDGQGYTEIEVGAASALTRIPAMLPLFAVAAVLDGAEPAIMFKNRPGGRGMKSPCPVGNRHVAAYQPAPERGIKAAKTAGRNDPCPCGCGRKAKKCEQRKAQ